jgi:hypothetical protein
MALRQAVLGCRVARWYIFKQKIPIGEIFVCLAMKEVGTAYGRLVSFTAILDILWPFGTFWYIFPVLVCCAKKHLATLLGCCLSLAALFAAEANNDFSQCRTEAG